MAPKKKSPEMAVTKRPDPILMSLCALVTVTVAMRITSIWHEAAAAAPWFKKSMEVSSILTVSLIAAALGRTAAWTCPPCSEMSKTRDMPYLAFVVGLLISTITAILAVLMNVDPKRDRYTRNLLGTAMVIMGPFFAYLLARRASSTCKPCA